MVGGFGMAVHFATLTAALKLAGLSFVASQSIATLLAMTSNFVINNLFTYRDIRLHGWQWLTGWVSFTLTCAFGAVANVGWRALFYRLACPPSPASSVGGVARRLRFYTWR
jgi:dolichol-phosphate mannosyltransferase